MSNLTHGTVYAPTMFLNKAVVTGVTGATATTFSATPAGTGAKMEYCIRGKAYSKSAISGGTTPTTDTNTGATMVALGKSKGCVFVLGLDASANIVAFQGPVVDIDASGTFKDAPEFPFISDLYAPFAYIVVKAGATSSGSWAFGSSNWDATGVTATPVDIVAICDRPQVS